MVWTIFFCFLLRFINFLSKINGLTQAFFLFLRQITPNDYWYCSSFSLLVTAIVWRSFQGKFHHDKLPFSTTFLINGQITFIFFILDGFLGTGFILIVKINAIGRFEPFFHRWHRCYYCYLAILTIEDPLEILIPTDRLKRGTYEVTIKEETPRLDMSKIGFLHYNPHIFILQFLILV